MYILSFIFLNLEVIIRIFSNVFKNIKITDNSDGTNYLKYYGCPYLGDSIGKVLVIPVNKVMNAAGNAMVCASFLLVYLVMQGSYISEPAMHWE